MFALRDVSQNLANLETAANFFNFKKIVRRFIIYTNRFTENSGKTLLLTRILVKDPAAGEQRPVVDFLYFTKDFNGRESQRF